MKKIQFSLRCGMLALKRKRSFNEPKVVDRKPRRRRIYFASFGVDAG